MTSAHAWVLEFEEHRPGSRVPVSMLIDGRAAPAFTAPVARFADGDGRGVIEAPSRLARALIRRLRNGRRIDRLTVGEDGGAQNVSLAGLIAAMTWVEDRQPRLAGLAPAQDPIVRRVADALDARADVECPFRAEVAWWAEPQARRLPDGRQVVRAPCTVEGGVVTSRFYLADATGALRPLRFVVSNGPERWALVEQLEGGTLGAEGDEIAFERLSTDGGPACGASGRWRWDGRRFAMIEARLARCAPGGAVQWDALWRAGSGRPEPTAG